MATPALIDLTNYDTLLIQSTQGRAGTPDGNVFFDTANGLIEFIPASELANVSYPVGHPNYTDGLPEANPLTSALGLKFEAIYTFENQERSSSVISGEDLRKYDRFTSGTFKFGGAYNFINARTPSSAADRNIIRGSGWNELNVAGAVIRIYFGAKGLSNIEATSQPYYQLAIQGTAVDFSEVGQIDEAVLVYRDDNGDGTPDEDNRTYMATSIRTYGQNHDRKETTNDLGITELGGYSTGFALNESIHLTTNETDHPIANVYNATRTLQTGVWLNMALNHIATPAAKSGEFSDETGSRLFSWELLNANAATLDQCVAWLDAFALNSDEADELGVNTGHLGKDIETWYYYNASGQIVTKSGVDPSTEGLYINSVPTADQQRIVMTDDGGTLKTYTFEVQIEADIGATAKADANAWYHAYEAALYNSAGAVTLQDSTPADVKGLASTADGNNKIIFARAYSADLNCVFLCEGDGGATQAKTLFTITEVTTVAFTCAPAVENNV